MSMSQLSATNIGEFAKKKRKGQYRERGDRRASGKNNERGSPERRAILGPGEVGRNFTNGKRQAEGLVWPFESFGDTTAHKRK